MFVLFPPFSATIVNSAKKTLTLNCEILNGSTQMLMKIALFPYYVTCRCTKITNFRNLFGNLLYLSRSNDC